MSRRTLQIQVFASMKIYYSWYNGKIKKGKRSGSTSVYAKERPYQLINSERNVNVYNAHAFNWNLIKRIRREVRDEMKCLYNISVQQFTVCIFSSLTVAWYLKIERSDSALNLPLWTRKAYSQPFLNRIYSWQAIMIEECIPFVSVFFHGAYV